jgi:hypothetical protein
VSQTPGGSPTPTPTSPGEGGTPTVIATPSPAVPTLSFPGFVLLGLALAAAGLLLTRRG